MIQRRTEPIDPDMLKLPPNFTVNEDLLRGLTESIQTQGLMHQPIVKEDYTVVAGKKRVLAARQAKLPTIECTVVPNGLEEEEYQAIALHENLKRYNLPWFEEVIQERELHLLRQKQYGEGKQGKKIGWSLRDSAMELQMSFGVLSEDIRLAEAVLKDPTLRKIEDKTTAKRVLSGIIKRTQQEYEARSLIQFAVNESYLGSSEVILKQFPDRSFDAVITDPPWVEYKDKTLTKDAFTLEVFREVFRVMKDPAFLYAFVSHQDFEIYQEEFKKIGFGVQKYPLIWIKEGVLTQGCRSWEYQRDYEPILVAVKGSPALTDSMYSAILSCKVVHASKLIHPHEKPMPLIRRILDQCSYEGALVLDPFAGSFVVPATCKLSRRRFIAVEKDKNFYANGLERLKNGEKD